MKEGGRRVRFGVVQDLKDSVTSGSRSAGRSLDVAALF